MSVVPEYRQRNEAWLEDIHNKVVNQDFDLVLVCRDYTGLVAQQDLLSHYICQGEIPAPITFDCYMPYPLEMWVPVSQAGPATETNAPGPTQDVHAK